MEVTFVASVQAHQVERIREMAARLRNERPDVKVTLVEGRREVLGFLDREITEAFQYHMRRIGMTLRLGEAVWTSRLQAFAKAASSSLRRY